LTMTPVTGRFIGMRNAVSSCVDMVCRGSPGFQDVEVSDAGWSFWI
jgi:hypothetical protein